MHSGKVLKLPNDWNTHQLDVPNHSPWSCGNVTRVRTVASTRDCRAVAGKRVEGEQAVPA